MPSPSTTTIAFEAKPRPAATNRSESRTLATLRDTLLPKPLSGEFNTTLSS